ncbi:FAM177 family [Phytophthora cinnamomi]|uniref:FAM177 family n=1 Tax=Phytophthora cinnamomi TaxID=4785 RepID=UPI0035595919|nr:FAM177 family [Phytophthora cinnamomi]
MTALERNQEKSDDAEQQATLSKPSDQSEDNYAQPDEGYNRATSIYVEVPRVAWEWICWSGAKTSDGMDFAGEVLANFLGLTQSKYQWVLDAQEREEAEKQQRQLEKRQRRQLRLEQLLEAEQRKLQELETGALEQDEESSSTV